MGVLGAIFEVEMELLIKKAAVTTAARVSEKCRICGKRYAKMRDFGLKSRGDSRIARKNIRFLIVFGSGMNFTKKRRGDAQATPARLAPPAEHWTFDCFWQGFFLRYFPSIATESNQRMPPKRKGVQHFGFKIVFGE